MNSGPARGVRIAWRGALLGALLVLLLLGVLLRWFERRQVYQPLRALASEASALGRPYEEVFFQATDGVRLHAWFFPVAPNSANHRFAVVFSHGNGGNLSHRLGTYELLLDLGVNVLAYDYRGYGRSQGKPSEAGTYLDAQAAYAWLRNRGFAAGHILAYGESLGGAIAAELALREPVGGLILQSAFTSLPAVGAELFPFLPVRWLASIHYDTRAKLPRVRVPVLILHGRADSLVPFHQAEENFAAANAPKRFCALDLDHNDPLEWDAARFKQALLEFLTLLRESVANQATQ
jgi:fermentation-respiration switch protein FrsA (DUF1100 family)